MNWKRHFIEAATLIAAAVACALVANAVASSQRKLNVVPAFAAPPPSARAASPVSSTPSTHSVEPPPTPAVSTTTIATEVQPKIAAEDRGATRRPKPELKPKPQAAAGPALKSIADFKPHPDRPYMEIAYDDVKALHDAGALFVDARRTSIYEQGHIAGARPFSVWEADIDQKVNNLFAARSDPRDQNKPIVAYCSGGDCEDSHTLAQKLWGIQFNNVYVYKDGFPDWQKHGGPIHTGVNP